MNPFKGRFRTIRFFWRLSQGLPPSTRIKDTARKTWRTHVDWHKLDPADPVRARPKRGHEAEWSRRRDELWRQAEHDAYEKGYQQADHRLDEAEGWLRDCVYALPVDSTLSKEIADFLHSDRSAVRCRE